MLTLNTLNGNEQTGEERLQIMAQNAGDDLSQRMSNHKLTALRAQHPFLQIMPMPNSGISVQLQPGVPFDINLPPEVKFVFPSGDQVYYLSRNGNAQVPKVVPDMANASFQNPEGAFLYVEECQSLSVVSPVVCNFTMGFFSSL